MRVGGKQTMTIGSRASAVLSCLVALVLGGCGGSTEGDVNSILAPSAGSTTTTPVNTSLTGQLQSERFPAQAARLVVSTAAGSTTAAPEQTGYGTMAITYNSGTGAYTVTDSGTSTLTVFTPADATGGSSDFKRFAFGNQTLNILQNGAANPRINLTYVTYGVWTEIGTNGTTTYRTAAVGVQTPYGVVPRTGNATYAGIVDGYWSTGTDVRRLLGSTGKVDVAFDTGVVNTQLTLSGTTNLTNSGTGSRVPLGVFQGAGTITASTNLFTGPLRYVEGSLGGNVYSGSYSGGFYGPAAQEVGVSFSLTSSATAAGVTGVLVGARQ